MNQAARRPYQMVSRTTQNALEVSVTSASMKRTHHVELTGQEVMEASKSDGETSRATRSARATEMATREVVDEVVRTAQRAAHAATQSESKRHRWLQARRVSTDGATAGRRTYLRRPNHHPSILDGLPTTRIHRVVVDDSNHDPEESVTPGRPTRSHGRAKAASGGSDVSYMSYMNRRWCRRVPKARYAKTRPQDSIEDGPRALTRQRDYTTRTRSSPIWWNIYIGISLF